MKKIIFSLLVILMGSVGAIAQIDINPSTLILESEGADQIFIDILITNNNSEDKDIYWDFEPAENYPAKWKTQICDLNLCYLFDDLRSRPSLPNIIAAGQEAKFTLKVKNVVESMSVIGSSYGVLRLFDDPDKTNEVASTLPLKSPPKVSKK